MRIAYLFDRPLPATETDSEQVMKTVAALSRRGVEIHLVLPEPRRKIDGASSTERTRELRDYYQVEGDFVVHELSNPLDFWSTARKWLHAERAIRFARSLEPDLLYTRNFPTLFRATASPLPFAYETYRPWADQFPPLKPPFKSSMRREHFLGAVLHSDFARQRYTAWGIEPDRLEVVLNGYDPKQFTPALSKEEARGALGIDPARKLVAYTGHINATKGLDVVLAMARRCPEVDFLLVGSEQNGLIERLAKGHKNIELVPWQPFDRIVTYLFAADVLLLPPSRVPLKVIGNTVLPMKLFLYLAAGRPILAPDTPDTREILHGERASMGSNQALIAEPNAILVPPGDAETAGVRLRELFENPERAADLSKAALATAAGLTWDKRAEKIELFLRRRLIEMGRACPG
jgi:glycosyltransferase involved in cell wall biosynthesis